MSCSDGEYRITVLDSRVSAPPCNVTIWRIEFFGAWVGKCRCGHWRSSDGAGNAFGWFGSKDAAMRDAENHLKSMDSIRKKW